METPKELYDRYVEELPLLRQSMTSLEQRHNTFKKKCESNLFRRIFHHRRLKNLKESFRDMYSSFDELNTKRTFLWGIVSRPGLANDSYISKAFNHIFEEIASLKQKFQEVDKLLKKCEKNNQ